MPKSLADKRSPSRARSSGFTLIEVMVALAITALALSALVAATGVGLENAGLADHYIEATRRAQSRLAEVGVTLPLNPGERSGDDGGGFSWRLRILPPATHYFAPQSSDQQPLGLYSVLVTITWRNGMTMKTVSLQTQRLGRIPAHNG